MFFREGLARSHTLRRQRGGVKWSGWQAGGAGRQFAGEGPADWRGGLAEFQGGTNSKLDKFPSPTM